MNTRLAFTNIAALAAFSAGALSTLPAHATVTDSLTGPSDISVVQSALTSQTDNSASSTPYLTSNTSNSIGNSRFGADYSFYSWTGTTVPAFAVANNTSSLNATIFGTRKPVLQNTIMGVANGAAGVASVTSLVIAGGNVVRNTTHGGGDFVNGATTLSIASGGLWSQSSTLARVLLISLTVNAQVNYSADNSVSGHVWTDGIDATLAQNGRVWVNATGTASVFLLGSAGIKINNLTLAKVSLPLLARAKYNFVNVPNACISLFLLGETYSMQFTELSGQVDAFYNTIFGSDDYLIAKWPGWTQSVVLFNKPPTARQFGSCFAVAVPPKFQSNIVG